MTPEEFIVWLKGFAASLTAAPTEEQWTEIETELDKVKAKANKNKQEAKEAPKRNHSHG